MSSPEIGGQPGIEHVAQPEGTELCFAAIVSAVTREDIETVHAALKSAEISLPNGETGAPMPRHELPIGERQIAITPLQKPSEVLMSEVQDVFVAIRGSLAKEQPIALMHKKTNDPDDPQFHWFLITGEIAGNYGDSFFEVMDPLQSGMGYHSEEDVQAVIERSLDTYGAHAYSLTTIH